MTTTVAPARTNAVLGTMTFADTVDLTTARAMVDLALESGVSAIDTANVYAGGATEEMLAELLQGRRDDVTLAGKVGMPHPDTSASAPLSASSVRAGVQGSLQRLRTDRLDLLYLHQPDRGTPEVETLTEIGRLIQDGLVGSWGVSNYSAWRIERLRSVARELGVPDPAVAQQLHNLVARRMEDEYAEFALTSGLPTVVYNPLAGGLLSGRHHFADAPQEGRFATSRLGEMYRQRYWDEGLFAAVEELGSVAAQAGLTLVELALRWVAGRPTTNAVLLGGSRPEHLRANLDALARGPLSQDVLDACDTVGARLRGPMPDYRR